MQKNEDEKEEEGKEKEAEGKKTKMTSPNQMDQEVKKGKAPKQVKRVDKPHAGQGLPHVHIGPASEEKPRGGINIDGTPHDGGVDPDDMTKDVKKWLGKHGWPTSFK